MIASRRASCWTTSSLPGRVEGVASRKGCRWPSSTRCKSSPLQSKASHCRPSSCMRRHISAWLRRRSARSWPSRGRRRSAVPCRWVLSRTASGCVLRPPFTVWGRRLRSRATRRRFIARSTPSLQRVSRFRRPHLDRSVRRWRCPMPPRLQRLRIRARMHTLLNVGFGLGTMIGGLVTVVGTDRGFRMGVRGRCRRRRADGDRHHRRASDDNGTTRQLAAAAF